MHSNSSGPGPACGDVNNVIPGVVSSSLRLGFSFPAAYGDLFASILAVLAIWSLSARVRFAISLVWVFNVWGAVDLLVGFYQGVFGVRIDPGSLGAAFFIPTVLVPPLLVTHGLMFSLLLRKQRSASPSRAAYEQVDIVDGAVNP